MKSYVAALLSSACLAAGCAAVEPALKTLAIAFGQDLISSASVNYTPRYAQHVESLLVSLARQGTGLDLQPQLTTAGYPPAPGRGYGQAEGGYSQDGYGDGNAYMPYDDEDYGEYSQYDDYDNYANHGNADAPNDFAGLTLDAAIFVQRSGATTLDTVSDGDVLYDGGDNPAQGDLLQFYFHTSRDAWVYVIGIDATGYVAQIFPDADGGGRNPVRAGREYVVPSGDQWWGLDSQAGVEQVFFVASETPRDDIEQVIGQLLAQPRRISTSNYRPVRQPAVVRTRGLVKVSAPGTEAQVGPARMGNASDTWYSPERSSEVVLTRWFMHESGR